MEMKKFFKDNGFVIICMTVCFAAGFVLGAILAPHHNRIEFNLFSGNGNRNRDNFSTSARGLKKGRKKHKKA